MQNPEGVLQALRRITVCDPACGSGAYLLGMLQELLQLRASLFTARNVDTRSVYDRKLEIIQNNIYGVDIDPFAVNIAQLRLWLSLIVDFHIGHQGDEPPTLPNLDYKIEAGDSVLGPDPSGASPSEFDRLLVEQYVHAKAAYLTSHGDDKKRLHDEVEELQASIRTWARRGVGGQGFDWAIEFAEVFDDGGFDVVVANPPYVRQELIKDIKPALKNVYGDVYSGTADLYTYFYARAVQMLRTGGMLAFISSNKWFRANYGANLRRYLAKQYDVWSITDFGELPVFQTAATFPMIFVARKDQQDRTPTVFTQVKSLSEPYPDVAALIDQAGQQLPADAIKGDIWTLTNAAAAQRLRRMEQAGVPLGEYVKGKLFRGVLTGFNTAFVVNGETRAALIAQDLKSAEIIKPLAIGDDGIRSGGGNEYWRRGAGPMSAHGICEKRQDRTLLLLTGGGHGQDALH
ncbi:MAG: Putative type IIS restriction /modification enzyme, N-terminal half, partial [uncultured Chloroflexia bacterium]